ncbi:unnamed protein product [Urochloa decumbens]|uniref:Fe2OG dioxygenase domain-containing protein n=1 Tax=Urochloa decumbens TaxID=240449 RepID=A0ABC9AS13_9POAL
MGSGNGEATTTTKLTEEIGKVDLRGLEPGTPGWAEARAAVTSSMAAHGCVVLVAHDALDEKLRRALFGRALPELFFGLPFDAKKRSGAFSNGPHRGYVGQVPAVALETVPFPDAADDPGTVRDLAGRLWPDDGNPDFCDTIVAFAKNVLELEGAVERMVLEGLGAREESVAKHLASQSHAVRVTLYDAGGGGVALALHAHRDEHMTTVIAQHEVGGLEVQDIRDGRWLPVPPEPGTLVFMAGDQFTVRSTRLYYFFLRGCHEREGAGVHAPGEDAGGGRPRALLGAAVQAAEGRRRPGAARHGGARRRGAPADVQPLQPRGVQGVPVLGARAKVEGARSAQSFLWGGGGEIRWIHRRMTHSPTATRAYV